MSRTRASADTTNVLDMEHQSLLQQVYVSLHSNNMADSFFCSNLIPRRNIRRTVLKLTGFKKNNTEQFFTIHQVDDIVYKFLGREPTTKLSKTMKCLVKYYETFPVLKVDKMPLSKDIKVDHPMLLAKYLKDIGLTPVFEAHEL